MALQLVVQQLHLAQVFWLGMLDGFEGAAAFQQGHHGKQRVGVVFRQFDDAAPAVRHQLHQALSRQYLQRFAQRCAAHLPGGGQGLFVNVAARQQFTVEHHGAQPRRDSVVHGGAAQGGGFGHGAAS